MKLLLYGLVATLGLLPLGQAWGQAPVGVGYTEKGVAVVRSEAASFTRSGERYNRGGMEAAHRHIPLESLVKITNLITQRSVVVRINDVPTGPETLLITPAAADSLGIASPQTQVQLEVIALGMPRNLAQNVRREQHRQPGVGEAPANQLPSQLPYDNEGTTEKGYLSTAAHVVQPNASPKPLAAPKPGATKTLEVGNKAAEAKNANPLAKNPVNNAKATQNGTAAATKGLQTNVGDLVKKAETEKLTAKKTAAKRNESPFAPTGTYALTGERVKPAGYGLQVASFGEVNPALVEAKRLEKSKPGKLFIQAGWTSGKKNYRVLIGTYATRQEAEKAGTALKKKKINGVAKPHFAD
ncbi:MAG: SPOR domain-containing protein [Bernardetiaceae bacterium]|jgi:septal ring-binding cell division protein DamX|nr:SPOR domain-containing protein [Bernardetiaceae bacterium]